MKKDYFFICLLICSAAVAALDLAYLIFATVKIAMALDLNGLFAFSLTAGIFNALLAVTAALYFIMKRVAAPK